MMIWIALKMLTFDRGKYLGSVAGVTFAALLIAQQASIFCGLLLLTTSQLQDVTEPDIWVMDPSVQFFDELKPMKEDSLAEVRGVPGIEWAVKFYKGQARMKLLDGRYQQAIVIGVDDATMTGAPRTLVAGQIADLRRPDAVIMDEIGYKYLWPGEPYKLDRIFEMNDHRAVLVGVCKASRTFQTFPVLYTRYNQALNFIPQERRVLPFVLVKAEDSSQLPALCAAIEQRTGLRALTRAQFSWKTIDYYLRRTGIPLNFGITVGLGFIVGCAIAGQTFYTFVLENLNQFGALKAMGVSNLRIVAMVLMQGLMVGSLGYGLGLGLASAFGAMTQGSEVSFYMPWQVPVITAGAVALIVFLATLISVRKVILLEPAVVFRG